ncbi:carboxymuconolactone decarboxylase family protein [Chryseobacterium flavum]|uniref:hypothetical protein n=1 Tax=Chryseobacterium flavum TaxID=415851 RepID=UPI0019D4AFF2|nr:hypothetical protein [Chryseobacterium flavum]
MNLGVPVMRIVAVIMRKNFLISALNRILLTGSIPMPSMSCKSLFLVWVEALTYSKDDWEDTKAKLIKHFTEREIVELTASITLMNTLNRLRVSLVEEE